jgi:hypothetical protein
MTRNAEFEKWALGYSGCDGGDIGSPQTPSIWVCGMEWGVDRDAGANPLEELEKDVAAVSKTIHLPPSGYTHNVARGTPAWKELVAHSYNQKVMRLLATIAGHDGASYENFAETVQPFCQGQRGYFKMNLYPFAFKSVDPKNWGEGERALTGLASKYEYEQWIELNRSAKMQERVTQYAPQAIICLGITFAEKFRAAFGSKEIEMQLEYVDQRPLRFQKLENRTILLVTPHTAGAYGLNSHERIRLFGERIRELIIKVT